MGHTCNSTFFILYYLDFFLIVFINVLCEFHCNFHSCIFLIRAIIVDSASAPSLFSQVLRCMRLMELWPGRESPESISGPFNRTPCRKGFNLLIREASEVRSCCRCQSQGKTLGNYFQCWQLIIQEAKAKTTHSSMMLQASKSSAALFLFIII